MDSDNNRVLEGSNINKQSLIASITKIMTCLITIMYSDLDKIVVVDEDVLKAYGSSVYLEVGEEIKLEEHFNDIDRKLIEIRDKNNIKKNKNIFKRILNGK